MKKVTMWMVIDGDGCFAHAGPGGKLHEKEKQQASDEKQVDQAIQEASGAVWVDEAMNRRKVPLRIAADAGRATEDR